MIARFLRKSISVPKSADAAKGFSNNTVTGSRKSNRPPAAQAVLQPKTSSAPHITSTTPARTASGTGAGRPTSAMSAAASCLSASLSHPGEQEDRGQHDPRGKIAVTPLRVRRDFVLRGHRSSALRRHTIGAVLADGIARKVVGSGLSSCRMNLCRRSYESDDAAGPGERPHLAGSGHGAAGSAGLGSSVGYPSAGPVGSLHVANSTAAARPTAIRSPDASASVVIVQRLAPFLRFMTPGA